MRKKTRMVSIRIDEHSYMRLGEIGRMGGVGISTVARAFIGRVLSDITNEKGYLRDDEEKTSRESDEL